MNQRLRRSPPDVVYTPIDVTSADFVSLTIELNEADLVVTKGDSSDPALVGAALTYNVIVTNNGPRSAASVVLTDTIPSNVTFSTSTPSQGSCTEASGVVTCDLGTVSNGGIVDVAITVTPLLSAVGTTISDTASVTSTTADPTAGNNDASEPTAVVAASDLSVTKTDSSDPVMVDDPLTYTVTVTNNGPSQATGVVLTDTLPADVTFGSVTPSQGTCAEASGTVICQLGAMASSTNSIITITVMPKGAAGGTTITNTASVTSGVGDTDTSNNTASQTTKVDTVAEADLAVTKSDSPDPVLAGASLTYTLTVTNNGTATAPNVVLTDTLPANVTVDSVVPSQGSCTLASGELTCNLGTIADSANATVIITVTPSGAAGGTIITNVASVASGLTDPVSSNDSVGQNTTVDAQADLQVTKTDTPDPVPVGDTLTYSLVVTNNGPSSAKDVVLTDTLPANVTYGSATASQGNCSEAAGVVTCNLGTISSGASVTASITFHPHGRRRGHHH